MDENQALQKKSRIRPESVSAFLFQTPQNHRQRDDDDTIAQVNFITHTAKPPKK